MGALNSDRVYRRFAWRPINWSTDQFLLEADGEILAVLRLSTNQMPAELEVGDRRFIMNMFHRRSVCIQVRDKVHESGATPVMTYVGNQLGVGGTIWVHTVNKPRWFRRWYIRRRRGLRLKEPAWPTCIGMWAPDTFQRADGFWFPHYVVTDQDGCLLIRLGSDGSVVTFLPEIVSSTAWTELMVVLALGWLVITRATRQDES
jgi:hypothetical protein